MSGVVNIGTILLGDKVPKICTSVSAGSLETLVEEFRGVRDIIRAHEGQFVDVIEIRMDACGKEMNHQNIIEALKKCKEISDGIPIIFTYRSKSEGGAGQLKTEEYRELLLEVSDSGTVDAVDVEIFSAGDNIQQFITCIKANSVPVIGSYHNVKATPGEQELRVILKSMEESGADIIKIAAMAANESDVNRMIKASQAYTNKVKSKPLMSISMGEKGKITRTNCSETGSCMTFGYLRKPSAPGQSPVEELVHLLK